MAAILHQLDQRRLIDTNGIADGASIYFYTTGTLTPAPVYTTAALSVEHSSPIVVAAGAAVPDIWLDSAVTYRRRIVYPDGSVDDTDPYTSGVLQAADLASTADGKGAAMVGFQQSGTGAVSRTVQSKLREEASLWDIIPDAYRADIEAGTSTDDVTSYINQALTNYRRVIVRRGAYRFSSPILFTASEQMLEFEDGAWFDPLGGSTNGIAVPHGLLDVSIINPGLVGRGASATGATGILWNSNAGGTAPYGSATSDEMGGRIEHARFKQADATHAWSNFIHSNMAGSLTVVGVHGRGLFGTASGYGYGVIFSGSDVTVRDIDVDAVIASQGRHGIYLGDQCAGADISGFRIRNFQKSGLAANTATTDGNAGIRIARGLLESVCQAADTSATNAGIELNYSGAATMGGTRASISDIIINDAGVLGVHVNGYDKVGLSDVTVQDWASVGASGAAVALSALKVLNSDNFTATNFQSFTTTANSGSTTIQHVVAQESSKFTLIGGGATNTGSGAQTSAVTLNATGAGTPNAVIDRFVPDKGSGSWSTSAYVNPTQNGSVVVYPKQGAMKTDTQTGADIVLDVSAGETSVTLDSGATSVLNMTAAGAGQQVTLICTDNTTIKATNFYIAGGADFVGTDNDTLTMVYNGSIWREVARSVN